MSLGPIKLGCFNNWFRSCNSLSAIITIIIAIILVNIGSSPFSSYLNRHFGEWMATPMQIVKAPGVIFKLVVVAPLIETLVAQGLPFWLAWRFRFLPKAAPACIAISALIFGCSHYYSLGYMVQGTLVGFVFATAYWLRGAKQVAFLNILASHLLYNVLLVLLSVAFART